MGIRLSALVGALGLALVLLRLSRLIREAPDAVAWTPVLVGGILLGAVLGALGGWLRVRVAFIALLSSLLAVGAMVRFTAADTLSGFLPTAASWPALLGALTEGWEQIRFGTAPIVPSVELLVVLLPVFVALGTVWAFASARGIPWLAIVGVGWFYLLVATVDRGDAGWWLSGFAAWVGLGLLSIHLDERLDRTRVLGRPAHGLTLAAGGTSIIIGLILTTLISPDVVGAGYLPWRETSTLGGIRTGVSYNLFASTIQTDLVAQSDTPVFEARIGRSPVAPEETFWRLITLDQYDGVNWLPSPSVALVPGEEGRPFEAEDFRFRGPTEQVLAVVRIAALRQNFLPFTGSPNDIDSGAALLQSGYRTRSDGSIRLDGLTRRGLEYNLTTSVPAVDAFDLASSLSAADAPVLREAAAQGLIALTGTTSGQAPDLVGRSRFLGLPAEVDTRISGLAEVLTASAGTPLEQALLLEGFFRQEGRFNYSVDIDPGHAASDLASWLFEENSANYRTGYCEQFATAMGVMARSVGLPSRLVLGFTPGDVDEDGLITVREKNAHAWVEVWIDGVGWVSFDPTPRSDGVNPATGAALGFDIVAIADTIELPEDLEEDRSGLVGELDNRDEFFENEQATPDAFPGQDLLDGVGTDFQLPDWAGRLLLLLGAMVFIPVAKRLRRFLRLQRARRGDISAVWAELTDQLRDLGEPITPSMTPREIGERVGAVATPLRRAQERSEYAPEAPSRAQRFEAIESLRRAEAGFRDRPLQDRLLAAWRPLSLRRTRR